MKKPAKTIIKPLFDMIDYCDRLGFDVIPVNQGKNFRFLITKNTKIIKIGVEEFPDWKDGQREVYSLLYNALSNE